MFAQLGSLITSQTIFDERYMSTLVGLDTMTDKCRLAYNSYKLFSYITFIISLLTFSYQYVCARRDGAPPLYSPSLTHVLSHATPSINLYLDSAGSGSTCLARVLAEALQGRGGEGGGVPER